MHDIAEIISEDYKEDGIYLKVEISRDDRFLVEDYVLENEEGKNWGVVKIGEYNKKIRVNP